MVPNIFKPLPQVKKFCYCFRLKTGCIMIGVIYLLFIVEAFSSSTARKQLRKCYNIDPFMQFLGYLALAVCATTLIFTLIFLYGVVKNVPQTLLYFMYTTILLLVFNLIMSIVLMFVSQRDCSSPYLFGGATFFVAILLIYFLIVVNSYYRNLTSVAASRVTAPSATAPSVTGPSVTGPSVPATSVTATSA